MILANATVDVLNHSPFGLSKFRVEVWGKEPHDYVRIYDIAAKNQDDAAREGLDRFTKEVSALVDRNA